jgi:hypothetical protein
MYFKRIQNFIGPRWARTISLHAMNDTNLALRFISYDRSYEMNRKTKKKLLLSKYFAHFINMYVANVESFGFNWGYFNWMKN